MRRSRSKRLLERDSTSASYVARTYSVVRRPGTISFDEGFSSNEPALAFSALRAPEARRLDDRSWPSDGLPARRVVSAGANGARLECQPGGAGHACIRQPPPAVRWRADVRSYRTFPPTTTRPRGMGGRDRRLTA